MTALAGAKTIGTPMKNEKEWVRVTYDFSVDGGASGTAVTVLTAASPVVITDFMALVKTAATSAGSACVSVGIESDADRILDSIPKATLALNAIVGPVLVEGTPNTLALPCRLAAGALVTQTIEVDTLTAGKFEYIVGYMAG